MLTNLAAVLLMHSVVWLVSLAKRDVSIVDLFWGIGFAVITWLSLLTTTPTPLGWLLVGMVTVWAFRLSGYLTWRNWGEPEDKRYAAMRDRWGPSFPLASLLIVFVLQAVLTWIVALPLQTAILHGGPISGWALAGVVVYATGLFFESVGDYQLAHFKADPANRGRVLDSGLWRYTRHPNYFGDFLVWWGVYLVSVQAGFVWWTLIGPVVMSILLMKVSGVTLLEKSLGERLGAYGEYTRRTNAFFPWRPKAAG
ncbi:hypothetical protein MalM25_14220 [Planctomycetes bacterium MalM25]|nr:hypothetical protein MalM25_14220 [Planctomycetes bacterium MalM25]